jgi:nitroreductase
MAQDWRATLQAALERRFGEAPAIPDGVDGGDVLARIAAHRSMRRYSDRPVPGELLRLLCAVALSAPSKSDLQQADIVIVADAKVRGEIDDLLAGANPWLRAAPALLVICGNNRRQRQLHTWRGHAFANDHLDAFFNASVDAAIVLATMLVAAESAGLGTCPLSTIRNHAQRVSSLLALPDHVFPVAGLALGWPAWDGVISPRLPLGVTVHVDRFDDAQAENHIDAYDRRRAAVQPYRSQRDPQRFGTRDFYGWSEDKARQYSTSDRADFGAFVRRKGFRLD